MKECEVNQRDWLHKGYADASTSAAIVQYANRELDAKPTAPDYHKLERMVRDYRAAQAALKAASAVPDACVTAGRKPTSKEVLAQELAHAHYVAACRRLYAD